MLTSKMYEVVLSKTKRKHFNISGSDLTKSDHIRISNAIAIWILILTEIIEKYSISLTWKDITRLIRFLPEELHVFEDLLKEMRDFCRVHSTEGLPYPFCSISGFTTLYMRMNLSDSDSITLLEGNIRKDWNTIFSFLLKLTLYDIVVTQQLDEAFEYMCEDTTIPKDLIDTVAAYVAQHYTFDTKNFSPKWSNGATYTVPRHLGTGYKVHTMTFNTRNLYVLNHTDSQYIRDFKYEPSIPVARLFAVPKSMTKKRFITIEETSNAFIQQGVRNILDCAIEKSTSHVVCTLEDQTNNANRSLYASYIGDYATIDLSSASDSIRVRHLDVFPKEIRRLLIACRSPLLECNNHIRKMYTYAGMGNACTFRVECIIFSAIAAIACKMENLDSFSYVYGDDIIIPTRAYNTCCRLLSDLGFKINQEKSFSTPSTFRESCGMEGYKGYDITPYHIPRSLDLLNVESPSQYDSWKDFLNNMISYAPHARTLLMKRVKVLRHGFYSRSPKDIMSLGSEPNSNLKWRYNKYLQRYEVLARVPIATSYRTYDEVRYYMTLLQYGKTSRQSLMMPEDRIEVLGGPVDFRLRWKFIPDPSVLS